AGPRMEPPVSEAVAPCRGPAAGAAPEPLDEPPGVWARFHRLRAGGEFWAGEWMPNADSGGGGLPRRTPPAAWPRWTTVDSFSGTQSAKSAEPPVVRMPRVR